MKCWGQERVPAQLTSGFPSQGSQHSTHSSFHPALAPVISSLQSLVGTKKASDPSPRNSGIPWTRLQQNILLPNFLKNIKFKKNFFSPLTKIFLTLCTCPHKPQAFGKFYSKRSKALETNFWTMPWTLHQPYEKWESRNLKCFLK